VVINVERGSPSAEAGLQPGDVILKVNDRAVATAAELSKAFKSNNLKEGVRLFVWRDGATLYVILSTGD
jgi:S1-C subfamily serine protease